MNNMWPKEASGVLCSDNESVYLPSDRPLIANNSPVGIRYRSLSQLPIPRIKLVMLH